MKLALGVQPISYAEGDPVVDTAKYLEKRFHVMETFVGLNQELVGDAVAEALVLRMEKKPFQKPLDNIAKEFRESVEQKKFDGWGPDIPTFAAQKGIRWRKSSPRRGPNRPSFLDTGTYKDAMGVELKDA